MGLDFEVEVDNIETQISELKKLHSVKGIDYSAEINALQEKRLATLKEVYSNLSAWQVVQIARHPQRPAFQDYLENIVKDFTELHGDRCFGDDKTITVGLGRINTEKVLIIGQNKGRNLKEKEKFNFGYAHPEGYRKALQKMKLAEKFSIPIVSFIDTPGAYPGIGAEERGQAYAIAQNLKEMSQLKTRIIAVVIGEGGSGGALGIGVSDRFAMLQYSYYSVIAPEACSAILWRDKGYFKEAAEALKLTSKELLRLKLIDDIIEEPLGSAYRDAYTTLTNVKSYLSRTLSELKQIPLRRLLNERYKKIRNIGKNI